MNVSELDDEDLVYFGARLCAAADAAAMQARMLDREYAPFRDEILKRELGGEILDEIKKVDHYAGRCL